LIITQSESDSEAVISRKWRSSRVWEPDSESCAANYYLKAKGQ